MTDDKQLAKAQEMVKAVYEDGEAEINGRIYTFLGTTHINRRKVFAFSTSIQEEMQRGSFMFLESSEFAKVEKVINGIVTFEDNLLSKLPEHWEKYPEDYMKFITTAMGVISYPFLKGNLTA